MQIPLSHWWLSVHGSPKPAPGGASGGPSGVGSTAASTQVPDWGSHWTGLLDAHPAIAHNSRQAIALMEDELTLAPRDIKNGFRVPGWQSRLSFAHGGRSRAPTAISRYAP